MTTQLLESRWTETKDALLEGLQGSKRTTMAVILENTKKHLMETATSGATAVDRKSTRLNSSHSQQSRMPSSA